MARSAFGNRTSSAGKAANAAASKSASSGGSRAAQVSAGQAAAKAASSAASQAASRAASQAAATAAVKAAAQAAATKAVSSAASSAAQRGAARAAEIAAKSGVGALNARGQSLLSSSDMSKLDTFTQNRLSVLDEEAKNEMQQDPEFQQAYPEISTFFSNLGRYDIDTQQKILSQIQSAANAQVDGAFNSEEEFVKKLQAIVNDAIQQKLGNFRTQEGQSLDKILGEVSRQAGDSGTQYLAQLSGANALDTGMLGSFADRLVEQLTRAQQQEKDASALAIKQAEDAANSDKSLADMSAEKQLFIGDNSIFARREAARAERYASLLGINADQELLAQTPTALNSGMPKDTSKKASATDYLPPRIAARPAPAPAAPSRITSTTSLRSTAPSVGGLSSGGVIAQRAAARRSKYLGSF